MSIQDIRDALVIRERDIFLITDIAGQVPRGNKNGYGLYYSDTRYLSGYEFSFSTSRPLMLLSTAELGYSSEQVMTNLAMTDVEGRHLPQGTIEVHRTRVLEDVLEEIVAATNYNDFEVHLELIFRFAADFADLFLVRGYEPEEQGTALPPVWQEGALRMSYKGSDNRMRQTMIIFTPRPDSVQTDQDVAFASFSVTLAPRATAIIRMVVTMDGRLESPQGVARFAIVEKEYRQWLRKAVQIKTDNDFFDAVLSRSLGDLRMLWNHEEFEGGYPAAGTPWFDTLFGRDTAIVGIQTLWLKPDLARQCLGALARHQGKKFDSWRDEEPGKILHELRVGELTQTGELPFSPYFGSIDSTPLFLMLAAEYFRWTADRDLMQHLETNLRAALHWIEEYGDPRKRGYVEYEKRSPRGLLNQGWKDSEDSMVRGDGSLVDSPITLVEVQAYVYAAQRGLAPVFRALGDEGEAQALMEKSEALRQRFARDFWLDAGYYSLALDGEGAPSTALTSNGGHALWGGIAEPHQALRVVRRMSKKDMFSGWGLRTLTSASPRFNPQGYHLGTVWPHDNSIAAMGFKRYGCERELNQVATALFDAAKAFPYYRLPELFGGTPRSAHHAPVPYPVACRPQAWAAGAFPLITQAILGLCPDAPNKRLYLVRPVLPDWLREVQVHGVRVGRATVDLYYERDDQGVSEVGVLDVRGDLQVDIVDQWPR
ncbi:MAG: amylo-alpha-1,6-glucosidase [Chloroflexi bacterium]|nr:MAG: amylo-alpha-1,6-glucosidase [Chloroflexota bacterium]